MRGPNEETYRRPQTKHIDTSDALATDPEDWKKGPETGRHLHEPQCGGIMATVAGVVNLQSFAPPCGIAAWVGRSCARAAQGEVEAQFWLGVGYERGYFGAIDYEESLKWLRKAAAQGLPDAQFCLGQMYEKGEGIPKSNERPAYWFKRTADHFSDISGVFNAVGELAYMYRDGRLKGNDIEAYMWFAVVDSSVDPPIDPATDDDVKGVAKRMSKLEIADAQQRARDWINRHSKLYRLPAVPNP